MKASDVWKRWGHHASTIAMSVGVLSVAWPLPPILSIAAAMFSIVGMVFFLAVGPKAVDPERYVPKDLTQNAAKTLETLRKQGRRTFMLYAVAVLLLLGSGWLPGLSMSVAKAMAWVGTIAVIVSMWGLYEIRRRFIAVATAPESVGGPLNTTGASAGA